VVEAFGESADAARPASDVVKWIANAAVSGPSCRRDCPMMDRNATLPGLLVAAAAAISALKLLQRLGAFGIKSRPSRLRAAPVTVSAVDVEGTVRQAPNELLAAARKTAPGLSRDEYAAARLVASELANGSPALLAAIIDSALNWAERRGLSLYESLTRGAGGSFGKQGKSRRASTRLDPRPVHVQAAITVLRGELRGISRGADQFFPRCQPPAAADASMVRGGPW
jgi:hypothetical protein